MWRVKVLIRAAFGFSRTETTGFLLLLPLSLVILFSEPVYRNLLENAEATINWKVRDSIMTYILSKRAASIPTVTIDLQTADLHQLESSGLRSVIASRLIHFREAGGIIRSRADLLKIYGMDSTWTVKTNFIFARPMRKEKAAPASHLQKVQLSLDINLADSIQLLMIKGVGPIRARRIILFREKLGGFVNMEQLKEVYGIDSTTLKNLYRSSFISQGFDPRKISLNRASWEEFSAHPYLTRKEAAALLAYRTQHGKFDSVRQILTVRLLQEERLLRLLPYLSL
ncbi:MAG: helix-hairpin-helix domain-containing protein [Bacteroidetes bacterium]|nr:helix-hairpin-helix domain-containing protein [Bacteroidota bacterium]MBS1977624.1 helix-hairpin-helix domain-containing protein [Bacteroidota bacterium]